MGSSTPQPPPVDPNNAIRTPLFFSYPRDFLYLLSALLALVSIVHFLTLLYHIVTRRRQHPAPLDPNAEHPIRLKRIPAAIADSIRAVAFRYTISISLGGSAYTLNLAELALTLGYITILLSWVFVKTTNLEGMDLDPKYFSNRAGLLAASQVPIIVALGMRNNIFTLLTGISHTKLNYFHRLSARTICILGWIHGSSHISIGFEGRDAMTNRWVRCGPLALSTLTVTCLLTVRPVRKRAYETFLAIHYIFAFTFIMALFFHLRGHKLTYYGPWPAMILWGLDRLLRLLQLALYSPPSSLFPALSPPKESPTLTDALIEPVGPHILRITIKRPAGIAGIRWRPGQSAYFSFPTLSGAPFASHPFTIASLDEPDEDGMRTIVTLVRVRRGTTALLARAANDRSAARLPVLINGPVCAPPNLADSDVAILFSGGTGVAFTLPLMLDAIKRATVGNPICSRIHFVWAVREIESIMGISSLLLPAVAGSPPTLSLSIQFCITGARQQLPRLQSQPDKEEDVVNDVEKDSYKTSSLIDLEHSSHADAQSTRVLLSLPNVEVFQGRPRVSEIIMEELSTASGRLSVCGIAYVELICASKLIVCGTQSLAENVREVLRRPRAVSILRGGATVDLHVEAFGGS